MPPWLVSIGFPRRLFGVNNFITFFFNLKGAIKRAVFCGVIATSFTVSLDLILSSNTFMLLVVSTPVLAFVLVTPIINHVRMFFAVRRHRNQMIGAVPSDQRAVILRREKKVAFDMMILIAVLVLSQVPGFLLKATHSLFPEEYRYLFPWGLLFVLLKASVDPIIYFWRHKELRNAIKSLVSC